MIYKSITSTRIKTKRIIDPQTSRWLVRHAKLWNSSGELARKLGAEKNRGGGRTRETFEGRKEDNERGERSRKVLEPSVECPFSWFLSSSLPGRRKPSHFTLLLSPFSSEGREASLSLETRSRPIPVLACSPRNWRTSKGGTPRWKPRSGASGRRRKGDNGAGTP